ncbi:MAG: hypothetical protein H7A37_01475 [Chlamydiales bacterium]|nr:hypothetical protein [Chlamydiia bacterium]MCP5506964.1 hypothetical protein [Chlamydiales bacterium]
MSAPVDPVETQPTQETAPPPETTTTTSAPSTTAEVSSATTVSSMEDLKKKAPEVYQKMLEGIAMNMITQMKRRQDHLKEIMREARRNAGYK